MRTLEQIKPDLDAAVRIGDIDRAVTLAKEMAQAAGSPAPTLGKIAIICLVKSLEYVVRHP